MKKNPKKKLIKKTPKKKVKVKRIRTEKEKKLFQLISANLGKTGKTKTIERMMLEAGYSKSMARQQSGIMCKIKKTKEFKNYIERLENHREKIMEWMDKKIDKAKYGELSASLARIENILLLSAGKPTSIINELSDKEKTELDKIYEENS